MTPPPINIDGTNENYSNVTIDGQDVTQITIDGQDVLITIPDSGLLRYPFNDGTATDEWGNNDGTVSGATYNSSGGFNNSGYYSFDGTDDYISTNVGMVSLVGDDSSFTFVAWVRPASSFSTRRQVICELSRRPALEVDADNKANFVIYNGSSQLEATSTTTLQTGTLYMIAARYDDASSSIDVSVDATQEGSASVDSTAHNDGGLVVGARGSTQLDENFDGDIDDPRIYDKHLSDNELQNLRDTGGI